MTLVLGIDAAWTKEKCSGVALLDVRAEGRRLICAAPSFEEFIAHADGRAIEWRNKAGKEIDFPRLLKSARKLGAGKDIHLIAIDMPLSEKTIDRRRIADDKVSMDFGKLGAAVHSPSKDRPGKHGRLLHKAISAEGFRLATTMEDACDGPGRLIEVFPLAALVRFLRTKNIKDRPRYKAHKTTAYWRGESLDQRKVLLGGEWRRIVEFLRSQIADLNLVYPDPAPSFAALKPYEDALNAIVCALIGSYVLDLHADCFGDGDAAIFVPKLD